MDRLVEVKINGPYLKTDTSFGGVQGEANITTLRIGFDEGWSGFDKTLYFLNAKGELPVKIDLTAALVVGERTYAVLIPGEALCEGGWFSFIVEGALDGVVQRSVEGKLYAEPVEDYEGARYPEGVEGSDTSAVFYAEYGVSTMDEIRAAFDAGKAVFAFRGIDGAGMIGSLVNISGEAIFVCHDGMNDMLFICDSNGWYEDFFAQPSVENGGYYIPSVDANGNLSWTASESGMPPVASQNIKGEKGDTPERGVDYWTEEDKTFVVLAAVTQVKDDELSTTALSVDWSGGKVVETLSDGSTVTHNMTFDANGIPTKIGNLSLTISGVD